MKGSLVNFAAIAGGALLGMLLRLGIPEKSKETILQAMGLIVVVIGVKMALVSENILIPVISLALGAALGEFLDIQGKLGAFSVWLNRTAGDRFGDVGKGFINSSLVFCIGAMAIVGSIQEGLAGDASILYAKAMIDGICSIVFAASMGIGVMLSAVPVLIYQGSLTLAASSLEAVVTKAMLAEISGTGGVLILAIGLSMLRIIKIDLANLIPSLIFAALLVKLGIF